MSDICKFCFIFSILSYFIVHDALSQSFSISQLIGETSTRPTQIAFGPDKRLYVLEVKGWLIIYTISRTAPNTYTVIAADTVTLMNTIQNHNDNGEINSDTLRQCTGMWVTGTATNPVVYISSSDHRVGGGIPAGIDQNLDTNSGVISKLTKDGGNWTRVDLVRGLPRSEENHATNGLFLDEEAGILYVAQGGNTNGGAPSTALAYLCEYALSGAILAIDLNILDTMSVKIDTSSGASYVYDLPTLDDPERPNANGIDDPMHPDYDGVDIHDPFGGNDGLNQARLTADGPVQIYASGFRNMYEIVITDLGIMYGWDNGPNPAYGGYPLNEGYGTATNNYLPSEPGSTTMNNVDCLHRIDAPGYYGGHPNPIRANPDSAGLYTYGTSGFFRTEYLEGDPTHSLPWDWPPVPQGYADPIQGDFQIAGVQNTHLDSIYRKSMNGICEYKASNFNGAMTGDLLTTGFVGGYLFRIDLDSLGNLASPDSSITALASNLIGMPVDVCTLGDEPPFPGTIWFIGHLSGGPIYILEPADFFECTGNDSDMIDEDSDGYTNADEYDNNTNPCSPVDRPDDFDLTEINGFLVSDLNDPDDDDDGIPDTLDFFARDPDNGLTTFLPIEYPLLNSDPGTGFYGLGFTGLMANGEDYLQLWQNSSDSSMSIIAGGTEGLFTIMGVDTGDAYGALNTQHNAFQFGIAIDSTQPAFIYEASLAGPVFPDTAEDDQSAGIYFGKGDQDNYVKLVVNANGGNPGILLVVEENGIPSEMQYLVQGLDTAQGVRLGLIINPANGFVRPQYALNGEEMTDLDEGFYLEGSLLEVLKGPDALAVGIIATSRGSNTPFTATWDHLSLRYDPATSGLWYTLQDGGSCQSPLEPGPCCQARHEAAFVQSGDKFYLLGGREFGSNVNIYDPITETWTIGSTPDSLVHHFQGFDYHGLIVAVAAFKGQFLEGEYPLERMRIYDPLTDTWYRGPYVPMGRRRGAAGVIPLGDTLYIVGGITNGHINGAVEWADTYDFSTNTWNTLPDAPHKRDHFHLAYHDGKLYAAAGRRTFIGNLWYDTEATVDVLDLTSMTWQTLPDSIPTERAGNTAAILGNTLLVIGGEREEGNAKRATEALNLETGEWRILDSLEIGRHGTQAIVNNGGIYVASGATKQGGTSTTRTVEAFHLYGQQPPILSPTIASELVQHDYNFDEVHIEEEAAATLYISNQNGNQAILIHMLTMFDSTVFTMDTNLVFPRFLKPGDSLALPVTFHPTAIQPYSDTIFIHHTGSDAPLSKIVLNGEGIFNWQGGTRAYVDSNATGTGLGTSWEDAFTSVQAALNAAAAFPQITEVWIAQGVYKPANSRTSSFVMRDGLTLYGGFHGTEILLGQRDVETFPVVFSGDIGVQDDATDNVYHVLFNNAQIDTATIDGITISHGFADSMGSLDRMGAGVLNLGLLVIRNCMIINCSSTNPGSALANDGASAYLRIENSAFDQNSDPELLNQNGATIRWDGENALNE